MIIERFLTRLAPLAPSWLKRCSWAGWWSWRRSRRTDELRGRLQSSEGGSTERRGSRIERQRNDECNFSGIGSIPPQTSGIKKMRWYFFGQYCNNKATHFGKKIQVSNYIHTWRISSFPRTCNSTERYIMDSWASNFLLCFPDMQFSREPAPCSCKEHSKLSIQIYRPKLIQLQFTVESAFSCWLIKSCRICWTEFIRRLERKEEESILLLLLLSE